MTNGVSVSLELPYFVGFRTNPGFESQSAYFLYNQRVIISIGKTATSSQEFS
jgi:hypothetical protein